MSFVVQASNVSQVLLQPNGLRREFIIENLPGASDMYINYDSTAGTVSAFSAVLSGGDTLIETEYPGAVAAIWVSPVGSAAVTEVLAAPGWNPNDGD